MVGCGDSERTYFYFRIFKNHFIISECDYLHILQIDKVKQRFERLISLANNNWIEVEPTKTTIPRSPGPVMKAKVAEPLKEKKVQATADLRAFLAGRLKLKV